MLDLFRSRDTAMRYLLVGLLSLVALSMVVTLIPGFGSSDYGSTDQTMATVCGEKITMRQVSQLVQIQIRNREMSPEVAELAIPQVVNQMVGELATACQAKKMGMTVSDAEVANGIRMVMPMLWQNGEFAGKEAYTAYLQRMNTNIPEFEDRVRQNIMLEKLQRVAFDGVVVTPKELETEYLKSREKARADVVSLDLADFRKNITTTRAELEAQYGPNKNRYVIPPQLSASLLIADVDKMGASLQPSAADLQRLYDSQKERFTTQERVNARHILVNSAEGASKEVDAAAKTKAQDLLNQVRAGKDFAELAKANSDDKGSGSRGGNLDWFGRGQMVKPFEDSAFSLKPKEISGLVKSQFGYHIIQVMEKETARTKPLDEVKAELISGYRQQQLSSKIPQTIDQARAELLKAPGQAQAIAQKYGLEFQRIEKWSGGGEFPVIGRSQEVDMALGALQKGGVTDPIELPKNRMVIGVLDNLIAARIGELNEVEERVKADVVEAKAAKAFDEAANALDAKIKATGNDLRKAAADLGYKVIDSGEFTRSGQMPNVPGAFFGEMPFTNPIGFVSSKFRVGSKLFFWKIVARTNADLSGLDKERQSLVTILRERKLRERRDLFEEGLVRQLKEAGSVSINEEGVKRMAASYRRS